MVTFIYICNLQKEASPGFLLNKNSRGANMNGYVYLVGAGPGDEGLITKSDRLFKACRYCFI